MFSGMINCVKDRIFGTVFRNGILLMEGESVRNWRRVSHWEDIYRRK